MIRPILFVACSVNHMLASGPTAIVVGSLLMLGTGKSAMGGAAGAVATSLIASATMRNGRAVIRPPALGVRAGVSFMSTCRSRIIYSRSPELETSDLLRRLDGVTDGSALAPRVSAGFLIPSGSCGPFLRAPLARSNTLIPSPG